MSSHDMIEIFPKNHLSIFVFRLEGTTRNGHQLLISGVIDVTRHCRSIVDAFDMIGHDSCMLEIATRLHPHN